MVKTRKRGAKGAKGKRGAELDLDLHSNGKQSKAKIAASIKKKKISAETST